MKTIKTILKSVIPNSVKKKMLDALRPIAKPPRAILSLLAYEGDFVVKVGDKSLTMTYTNRWIENDLYWKGITGYEKTSMTLWMEMAERAHTIVDIGANTGLFSLVAKTVNPSSSLYAFEPLPKFRDLLVANCVLNDYDIKVESCAVSNFIGTSKFYVPEEYKGNQYASSLSKEHYLRHQGTPPQEIDVRVITFDSYAKENNTHSIDLIKIDAEGHDYEVLEGMKNTISKDRPDFLIEIQTEEIAQNVTKLLSPDAYLYFNINEEHGVRLVPTLTKSDTFNFLICKTTTAAELGLSNG